MAIKCVLFFIGLIGVPCTMFLGSKDFFYFSNQLWEGLQNVSISEEQSPDQETDRDSQTENQTAVDDTPPADSDDHKEVAEETKEEKWSLYGYFFGSDEPSSEESEKEGSGMLDWFASPPPEPPCPLLYIVLHHQGPALSTLYQMVHNWWVTLYQMLYNWWMGGEVTMEISAFSMDEQEEDRGVGPVPPHMVLIQAIAFLFLESSMLIMTVCTCLCWRSKRKKTAFKLREEQRIQQEKEEREAAKKAMSKVFESSVKMHRDWGSRLQKYWHVEGSNVVTIAPIPKNCSLDLAQHSDGLNQFVKKIREKIWTVQPIYSIKYLFDEEGRKQIAITQPFHKDGSLRDIIHGEDPTSDWSQKYLKKGTPLPLEKVAKYGRQILEAMIELYLMSYNEDLFLSPLEHVHVGNIFVKEDICLLGGYENRLLGYRPRLYSTTEKSGLLLYIDVIMFGHVIYEMAAGRELQHLIPREDEDEEQANFKNDYKDVKDEGCKEILRYIFARKDNGQLQRSIKEIKENKFFDVEIPKLLYPVTQPMQTWGSAVHKCWYLVGSNVVTVAPLSDHCFLDLDQHLDSLNKFLKKLKKEISTLQLVYSIKYSRDKKQIAMVQPFHAKGSLRDLIHREDPTTDWSKKYSSRGTPLSPEKVAKYGRQILETLTELYLMSYNEVSLSPLQHVHMGNIFVKDDTCLLGGYENRLLGYRPRLYETIEKNGLLLSMDVIMFGHVMYEMSAGRKLQHLIPEQEDYRDVEDESCKEILEFIFTRKVDGQMQHSISEIQEKSFFPELKQKNVRSIVESYSEKLVPERVRTFSGQIWKTSKEKLRKRKDKIYDTLPLTISRPRMISGPQGVSKSLPSSPSSFSISAKTTPSSESQSDDSAEHTSSIVIAIFSIAFLLIVTYIVIVLLVIL